MVEGYTGLPGSGKTYLLARDGIEAMRKKRPVYANFSLRGAEKYKKLNEIFHVRSGVILVDEINLVCPSRWWNRFPPELAYFWSQTRKMSLDIYWSAQHIDRVDKIVREISNFAWWCQKMPFGIHWAKCYLPEHISREKKDCFGHKIFTIDKKIASCYNTYELLDPTFNAN